MLKLVVTSQVVHQKKSLTFGQILRENMGALFKIPAGIIYIVGGIWGFFICLGIVTDAFGFIGGLIAFFLLPITLYLAPWYVGIANGNWFPVLLIYGSGIAAAVLFWIGAVIDRD